MKKLNKKGFTLIELLAVIVILAIIVVVTVPTILNSINDARLSSLHSLSKEVANWYDTSAAQDLLAIDSSKKILHGATITETWQCINQVMGTEEGYKDKSLADFYGLSSSEVFFSGENKYALDSDKIKSMSLNVAFDTNGKMEAKAAYARNLICSQIRLNNGRAEVLLIANSKGKFNTSRTGTTYALSSGTNSFAEITVVE